jgi:hypothetical protein
MTYKVNILPWIIEGENSISAVISDQSGASGYSIVERTGLWIEGGITSVTEDNPYRIPIQTVIRTDGTWQCRTADWYEVTPFFYTVPIGKQEHYLAEKEPAGWKTFQDAEDAGDDKDAEDTGDAGDAEHAGTDSWHPAFVLGGTGTPPWKRMQVNDLPPFDYTEITPAKIWEGFGPADLCDLEKENPAAFFEEQLLAGKITGAPVTAPSDEETHDPSQQQTQPAGQRTGQQTQPAGQKTGQQQTQLTGQKTGQQQAGGSAGGCLVRMDCQNVTVFDAGETIYGYPEISIGQAEGDIRLELFYDNRFEGMPSVSRGFRAGRNEGACDSYTPVTPPEDSVFYFNQSDDPADLKDPAVWRTFRPRGFHFLTIRLSGRGSCTFRLRVIRQDYAYGTSAELNTGNDAHRRIWDISAETLRRGTTDVIGEPFRENVLWTFDACVGGLAAWHTFGESAMWRHCLRLIGQGIDEDGIPQTVVPGQYSFMILFDQLFYWVVSCHDFLRLTGDRKLAEEVLPAAVRLLKFCVGQITPDGLFIPPSYAWHWIDWADVNREPYAMPVNAMLLWALQACTAMGTETGLSGATPETEDGMHAARPSGTETGNLSADLKLLHEAEEKLRTRMEAFYDEDLHGFRSRIPCDPALHHVPGIDANSCTVRNETETDAYSNALACWTGIGTAKQRKAAAHKTAEIILHGTPKAMEEKPAMGIGWVHILLHPVLEAGMIREVEEILAKYYGPCIKCGTRTWGEDFVPTPFNTAHAWGACVNTLLAEYNANQ